MKVNLGCGVDIRDGYMNVDWNPHEPRVWEYDETTGTGRANYNLDDPDRVELPFAKDDSVDEWLAVDLVEHLSYPLPFFQELYRCSVPGARFDTAMPYGTSDDAWEDPTHVRPWLIGSWRYLSQPIYYRADYGYDADWDTERITLDVAESPLDVQELREMVAAMRNVVLRQYVTLRAVKPARPRDPSLLEAPPVFFRKMKG